MLEKILRLYTTAMVTGVTSPLPHLFGPPGSGKSKVCQQAADIIGVRLHTINLSRVSPLELEGVQMPTTGEDMKLRLLHATYWTQIQEGDIVLFDEFLRAFPEVHNGLLDILTAREVGGLTIPRAFFLGASNSVIAYDKALEDRLLHLPVADPRKSATERKHIASLIVGALGLLPSMETSHEMDRLIQDEVAPMYDVMDNLTKRNAPPNYDGSSVRNLIGQALLREVQSTRLRELLVVRAGVLGVTHYEQLAPLFQQDWDAVVTIADYDSSPAAADVLRRCSGKIGQLFDVSLVNRSTYLAQCLLPLAAEVRPLLIASDNVNLMYQQY